MDHAKQQLAGIVGEEAVCDSPEVLEGYARDRSSVAPVRPRYVVWPGAAAQVQTLVKWANETRTPLLPVSSGPPHFYGDTVPSVAEVVVVDLTRLTAVMRIDRRNRIVVIEPGVTYAQLEPALAAQGLRIPRPLLPRKNKSVVASLLERQPTTIPRLNYSLPEPLRVCGVVWGTGDVAFTGEAGSGPASLEAQWGAQLAQVNQQGPLATDLMRLLTGAQGSMGVVVWASIKCQLLPAIRRFFTARASRIEDLADFYRQVERVKLGDEVLTLNRARLAEAMGGENVTTDLPPWSVLIGISGAALLPEEKVAVQELDLRNLASSFGVDLVEASPEIAAIHDAYSGAATSRREIFFLTTLDRVPGFVNTVFCAALRLRYPAERIGVYVQPQHQGVSQHVEFAFPFDPEDKAEAALAEKLFRQASQELAANGAYFSRPYGEWADMVYSRDANAVRVLRAAKKIVDPNNILNPGKLCF